MPTNSEKKAVLEKIFKNDIEEFGKYFFPQYLTLATPQFHQEIYAVYKDSSLKRIAIAAPRGHAKSTITDLIYLAWEIVYSKVKFVLLVSDTYSQATLFLETLKAEFENNDLLKEFYGSLVSEHWSEGEIVANNVMVKALGAGMKVRGLKFRESRPDLVLVDDLENDELVESLERREKLERWFNKALIPSMDKNGRLIVIGTILHYDSLLSKLLDKERYKEFFKKVYRAITNNQPLWKEHLNLDELNRIKQDYLNNGLGFVFYQEYQNDPVSDENRKFKIEKFKYLSSNEAELEQKNLSTYITIDRGYSTEKTADFTGIIVNSVDSENTWYIRMAERFKGNEKELITKIFDLKEYYHPIRFGIEQKAYEYTLKPALDDEMRKRNDFFAVIELKDLGRSKNIRIEGLVPRFETGSVYIKKDQTDLIDELIMFPKAVHDDLADALAYQLEIARMSSQTARQYRPQGMNANSISYPTKEVKIAQQFRPHL